MPDLLNPRPVTSASTNTPILEKDASVVDLLISALLALLALSFAIISFTQMSRASWGGQLTIGTFFLGVFIFAIFSFATFHLYPDRLVIRRPLSFTSRTEAVFPLSGIKEVIFKKIKGHRGTGICLIIKSRGRNAQYDFDKDIVLIDQFIAALQKLGVKASKQHLD